jgi:ankyrin repeat protein
MKKAIVMPATVIIFFIGVVSLFGQGVSDEAKKHVDRGLAAMEIAKSPEDFEPAIKEFERAIKLAPDWPEAYRQLALAQEKADKYGDAAASLKQYLRLAPSASDAETVNNLIEKLKNRIKSIAKGANAAGGAGNAPPDIKAEKEDVLMPLFIAVRDRDKETVKRLIAEGADVNGMLNGGWTPLVLAARKGYEDVAELLIAEGADISARNKAGLSPLDTAVLSNYKGMVELLIAKGANINARDKLGLTPLHFAVRRGFKDIAELLIAQGADVNAKSEDGSSPLHEIRNISSGRELAELLVSKGADINAKDNNGETPLRRAKSMGLTNLDDLLVKKGGFMGLGMTELFVLLFILLVPIWLIAFVDILRNDFKGNDKIIWILVVIFVPFLGPLCYLFIGMKQKIGGKK